MTADTLIGHLGRYEVLASYEGGKINKSQLHYEIFTNTSESELNDFLNNTAELFQDTKYIKLTQGTEVLTQLPDADGSTIGYALRGDHAIAIDSAIIVKDRNNQAYYRITVPEIRQDIIAYHPKSDDLRSPDIICQHDWSDLGFKIIEESDDNSDGFLNIEKTPEFFQALHKEIDEFGGIGRKGYGDGVITAVELKLALNNQHLRNKYIYAYNDPINLVDPSGNNTLLDLLKVTEVQAILVTMAVASLPYLKQITGTLIGNV